MTTEQPIPVTNNFIQDDYKAMGVQVELPEGEKEPPQPQIVIQKDEANTLALRSMREAMEQNSLLVQQLMRQQGKQPQEEQKPPEAIHVKYDKDNKPVIDPRDLLGVVQPVVDQYHKTVVAPMSPAIEQAQQSQALQNTVNFLKKEYKDIIPDGKETEVAGAVWGFYNSPLNPGVTDDQKTQYAVEQVKKMTFAKGNPTLEEVRASNQVGRTDFTPETQLPYPKGATIKIPMKAPHEVGIDYHQNVAAMTEQLEGFNKTHNAGYKIVFESAQ